MIIIVIAMQAALRALGHGFSPSLAQEVAEAESNEHEHVIYV